MFRGNKQPDREIYLKDPFTKQRMCCHANLNCRSNILRQYIWPPVYYRPHPKDGEGNSFTLLVCPRGGGQVKGQSSWGGGGQVKGQSRWGGQVKGQSSRGVGSGPAGGGGSGLPSGGGGGVSILRPVAGDMPLAFTQEDFLVKFSDQISWPVYLVTVCKFTGVFHSFELLLTQF